MLVKLLIERPRNLEGMMKRKMKMVIMKSSVRKKKVIQNQREEDQENQEGIEQHQNQAEERLNTHAEYAVAV